MRNNFLRSVFNRKAKRAADTAPKEAPTPRDPLDPFARLERPGYDSAIRLSVANFPLAEDTEVKRTTLASAMDAVIKGNANDGNCMTGGAANIASGEPNMNLYQTPPELMGWYASQSFIGYQACAVIAQHWLVDKACTMAGEDAIRNGWDIKAKGEVELSEIDKDRLRACDVEYKVRENLVEAHRFKNIFGIRIVIFEVDCDDEGYYEKPFNPDAVTPGSYKGMSQVDPYWMMPMLTAESTSDPSSRHFYDPEFWIISGQKYHRSHLVILRGPQPADVLKPTYIFGGISLTQRIYERVYAAERTANEAPLLSMSKRTSVIHTDLAQLAANEAKFTEKLLRWIKYRDNHAVKVLGTDEVMEQFDVSLADFDSVINNQYQLVSAIAEVPSTKLLGTSPKGFNATGEFEMKSYHEKLTSIQSHEMEPTLDRHYLLLSRSEGISIELNIVFDSVDSPTAGEQADLNLKKAQTGQVLVDSGAISPDDELNRLKDDKRSGYNRLAEKSANEEPGMSPENIAALEKGEGDVDKGEGALAGAAPGATPGPEGDADAVANPSGALAPASSLERPTTVALKEPGITEPLEGEEECKVDENVVLVRQLLERLTALEEAMMPEGVDINAPRHTAGRSTQPSAPAIEPTVVGIKDVVGPAPDPSHLPKLKLHGMVLAIENPRGTIRKGTRLDGTDWAAKMSNHYGFIKGVIGADGDELDAFVGPSLKSQKAYVVNQNDMNSGEFDEHKCMLGFDSPHDAKQAYDDSFSKDWTGFDSMFEMDIANFKNWFNTDGACASPLNEACIGAVNCFPQTDGV